MFLTKEEQSKIYKEIFPYNYYTKENYLNEIGSITDAFKHTKNATIDELSNSITKANALLPNGKFNMQIYAEYYCQQDVCVLVNALSGLERCYKHTSN